MKAACTELCIKCDSATISACFLHPLAPYSRCCSALSGAQSWNTSKVIPKLYILANDIYCCAILQLGLAMALVILADFWNQNPGYMTQIPLPEVLLTSREVLLPGRPQKMTVSSHKLSVYGSALRLGEHLQVEQFTGSQLKMVTSKQPVPLQLLHASLSA